MQKTDHLCAYWEKYTPGWTVSPKGRRNVQRWLKTFSLDEIIRGMDIAVKYLRSDGDGAITQESWELAFQKIGGICQVEKVSQQEHHHRKLYYIRGILKNRFDQINQGYAIGLLREAVKWNADIASLEQLTKTTSSWTAWRSAIKNFISQQKAENSKERASN